MKFRDWLEEELDRDPEFRAEWERSEPDFQFRSALIGARLDAGLTQAALAERIGTKQSAIARLESGSSKPSFDMLGRLTHALNVSFEIGPGPEVRVHQQAAIARR
jgi:transcriptional regulator with XRE-family HTH domain